MRRLNNSEVKALAEKIYAENVKDDGLPFAKEVIKEVNKIWKDFKKSKDCKVLEKYDIKPTLSMCVERIEKDGFEFTPKYRHSGLPKIGSLSTDGGTIYVYGEYPQPKVTVDLIKREIILSQIEANDLESIISKVKENLSL